MDISCELPMVDDKTRSSFLFALSVSFRLSSILMVMGSTYRPIYAGFTSYKVGTMSAIMAIKGAWEVDKRREVVLRDESSGY